MNIEIFFSEQLKTPLYITDDTHNFATCLTLVGRNVENYGATIWTDFINVLENYANDVPPKNPVEGQLWYDTKNKELMVNHHRHIGYNDWQKCAHMSEIPDGLLLKSGGTLYVDSKIIGDITDSNNIVHKKYVDEHCKVTFENSETPYQYNMDNYNGFITINGNVPQSKLSSGAFDVELPRVLSDYIVNLSIDGIYLPKKEDVVSIDGKSGGEGTTKNDYNLENASDVSVSYDMYGMADRMKVLIDDVLFKDTGDVSNGGIIQIPNEKIPKKCKLTVIMEGPTGTSWEYKLNYQLPPKMIKVEPYVYNYMYYVSNKRPNGFTIVVSKDFPETCNINFNVAGMVAK